MVKNYLQLSWRMNKEDFMAKKYTKEERKTFRKKNKALGLITNIITGMLKI